jgi:predicted nuclease with TOPRIM domain
MRGNKRTDSKDIEERVARETKLDMKLDEIGNDVKEVKETVRTIQGDVKNHEGRIVKLEASYARLHERVDNFPNGER